MSSTVPLGSADFHSVVMLHSVTSELPPTSSNPTPLEVLNKTIEHMYLMQYCDEHARLVRVKGRYGESKVTAT